MEELAVLLLRFFTLVLPVPPHFFGLAQRNGAFSSINIEKYRIHDECGAVRKMLEVLEEHGVFVRAPARAGLKPREVQYIPALDAVSYTHLDVYKRQGLHPVSLGKTKEMGWNRQHQRKVNQQQNGEFLQP